MMVGSITLLVVRPDIIRTRNQQPPLGNYSMERSEIYGNFHVATADGHV
jgi:hypothetical protein